MRRGRERDGKVLETESGELADAPLSGKRCAYIRRRTFQPREGRNRGGMIDIPLRMLLV
jgi:hypothetical protein